MQHFLFHSPEPGTGKTTLAYIMADALGYQLHKFNASSSSADIEFIEEDVIPMSRIGQWETVFFSTRPTASRPGTGRAEGRH